MCFQDVSSMFHDTSYFQVYIASISLGVAVIRKLAMQPVHSAERNYWALAPVERGGTYTYYAKTSWNMIQLGPQFVS